MTIQTDTSTRPDAETLRCWDCERPIGHHGRCDACDARFEDSQVFDYLADAS